MKGIVYKLIMVFGMVLLLYVGAFIAIKLLKPSIINTNDGPTAIYTKTFFPLRYVIASRSDYVSLWPTGKFKAEFEGGTSGSHVYFTYKNKPYSPYCDHINENYPVGEMATITYSAALGCDDLYNDIIYDIIVCIE